MILNKKVISSILVVLFFANIISWVVVFDLARTKFLEVNFFDVGQGDAIFIETPERHQILIDGGPSSAILEKLGREMPFWDRTIDLVILTHPEKDHIAGLLEVLKKYKVENILWTGVERDTSEYNEWVGLLKSEGAKIKIAQTNQKITSPGLVIKVLYPFENLEGKFFKDSNDTSVVSKLIFGKNSFLFTGDIYKSVEKELIDRGVDIGADVLKVAHHGSKTSTSEEFLKEISPEVAVISVGKDNSYGHPHQEVLDILGKYGINVLRTDLDRDIKIFSDGTTLRITNQN